MRPDTDGETIASSVESPERFGEVFDRHFAAIRGYLRGRLGTASADELASQVFLIAFDRRAGFDSSRSSARPWLYGIATNLLRNQRRQEIRELRAYAESGIEEAADGLEGLEARLDAELMRRRLAEALSEISTEEADVLALFAWEELSYAEIGEALGLPMGTVKSRLSRARARIRESLGASEATADLEITTRTEVDDG